MFPEIIDVYLSLHSSTVIADKCSCATATTTTTAKTTAAAITTATTTRPRRS